MSYSSTRFGTAWNWLQIPRDKGSVSRDFPGLQVPAAGPASPVLLTDWLKVTGAYHPLLGINSFARAAHRSQETHLLTRLLIYYKGC